MLLSMAAFTGGALAGSANFNFNTDPSGILTLFGNSIWRETGGVGGTGYMSITDAVGGQSGTIVFDDLDPGGIVNAFTFSCDLRTGGGTGGNPPADGYSVSFARAGDPAITGGGFLKAREEGTDTGLAICLDEWDSGNPFNEGPDVVGISVRVDGVLKSDFALPTRNGTAADTTSLQTGPADRVPDPTTFDVADHSFVNLTVTLEPDGTLDVSYKGVAVVSNLATGYIPGPGQLIFAGRTGGANSNHHVDNIVISTTVSSVPILTSTSLSALTLNAAVTDSISVAVDPTKPFSVTIDGTAVAAAASKAGNITTFTYSATSPAYYAIGSHPLVITFRDTNNNPITLSGNAIVAPYATMDPAWKAAAGQVDTVTPANQLTMLARIHQLSFTRTPGDANLLPLPEIQIQNGYFDRVLNTVAPNVANPTGFDNPLTFEKVISGVLNWDQASGAQGNFNAGNGFPESPIPGIPGTTGNDENVIGEVFTWLDLPAGLTRLGVNSDDGFTLSVGASPLDFFGKITAGVFNGGRGASDTQFDIAVPTAGLYPVRLLWWEGGGGANLEFFSVKPDGTRVLINDTVDAAAIKGYYSGVPLNPSIHAIAPYPGTTFDANNRHPLLIELLDGVNSVTDASIVVKVDDVTVTPTVTSTGITTKLEYLPASGLWPPGTRNISLSYTNSAAVVRTETWSFRVAGYATLDVAWKAAAGQVDTANQTMLARIHQLSFARTPGDSNLLPLPEIQIQNGYWDATLGTIAPNVAQPAGIETIIAGALNWDQDSLAQGNFTVANGFPEAPIPGIPGTTGNNDNIAGEIFTWLDLPAGPVRLGVNSDDGFTLSVGASPLDHFGKITAGVFNGGRGASDTQFDLEVPVAGLYPVRLLWWEGGGGANVEFFSVKPDGNRVLINDPNNDPLAIKAYHAGLPSKSSIHAISPYPGTLVNNNKHPLTIELVDGLAAVNDGSILLTVDGVPAVPTVTNNGLSTVLSYLPAANGGRWTFGNHTVSLTYNTTPATVARTETWIFNAAGQNYVWEGGGTDPNNITDPTNWVGDIAPTNDGTNINLGNGEVISFALNNLTIPDSGGRQINLAAGAQIFSNKGGGGDCRVNARVNAQGVGADNNGFFYVEGGGWGMPNNLVLVADGTTTANGANLRIADGPNRLDLGVFTLTTKGNSETVLGNTNVIGAPGSRMLLQNFTAFEGGTRLDPNITVELAGGVTLSSWGGQGARRDSAMVLNNNSIIETRFDDDDLTFSGPVTVATGNTGILRPKVHVDGNPNELNGQDLRLNILGPLAGDGKFRKEGGATLLLSGAGTNTGGLDINGTGNTVLASDTAAGTGPINVNTSSTLAFTNAGGQEYIDAAARDAALDDANKTVIDAALSGVNSRQALGGNRRTSYTGKLNNPTASNLLLTFAEQYDDETYLEIDGTQVLSDGVWNVVTSGQISLSPGSHDFRVSMRDGGGGSGPNNSVPGWDQMGIGYSFTLPDDGAGGVNASKTATDYIKLGRNYEVYQPVNRSIANAVVLNTTGTISTAAMNGYDATIGGNISGTGGLAVIGSSNYTTDELILSGTGSYTGSTSVSNGTLIVNGNFSTATGAVTVEAGATLGGSGTVGGVTTVAGGIAPGSGGIGTLNIAANTTWDAGNSWIYELGATTVSDRLAITGNFTKGSGSNFAFNFSNTGAAGTYTLVTWTGTTNFVAGDFSASNLGGGSTGAFAIIGNSLVLNVTAGGYAVWSATAFTAGTPAGDRLPAADPDKDGINNLMEYALNTNPSVSSAGPAPEVATVGADKFLQIRWTRPNNRTDITTSGEVSTDLTPALDWVTGPANVTTTFNPAGAGQEEVIIRSAQAIGSGPRRFIRAKVTQL